MTIEIFYLAAQIERWLNQQVDARLVEPNSSLGKAMASMHSHWETLTR